MSKLEEKVNYTLNAVEILQIMFYEVQCHIFHFKTMFYLQKLVAVFLCISMLQKITWMSLGCL